MADASGDKGAAFDFGFGGLLNGLSGVFDKLQELAEKGGEIRREGTFGDDAKGRKGIFGFSVRVGGLGGGEPRVEPFGNIREDADGSPTVVEEREPMVDVFEEEDQLVVIAELPGVEECEVKVELHGDVLEISAASDERRYRKELLLSEPVEAPTKAVRNGILEARLPKRK